MPYCKHCNEKITKFDKEICPFCGGLKPLEGVTEFTEDYTKAFEKIKDENKKVYRFKTKKTAFYLTVFLGFLGGHGFYLSRPKLGFVSMLISLLLIGGIGSLLAFVASLNPFISYILPFIPIECFYILLGFRYLKNVDTVDGNGDLLR